MLARHKENSETVVDVEIDGLASEMKVLMARPCTVAITIKSLEI